VAAIAVLCSVAVSSASAATITVTNLGNAGAGTLRAALETAPSGSTIVVPAGTISLAPPALPVTQSVTITGAGAGATTISGGGATRVMTITGFPNVTLEGLTITGGAAQFGGGINSTGGTLTLKGVSMTGNDATAPKAAGFGGAILVGPGALNIIDSTLTGNLAGGEGNTGFGGAIFYLEEPGPASFTLSIQRSTLTGNSAGGAGGTGFGGAIEADASTTGAALSVSVLASTLTGNSAGGSGGTGFGGAMDLGGFKEGVALSMSVLDSTLAHNAAGGIGKATGFGGAVDFDGTEKTTDSFVVERSAITGNVAGGSSSEAPGFGGGLIYEVGTGSSASARVLDTTVAQNSAGGGGSSGFGGGIEAEGPVTPSLSFDTIAGNSAGGGGGKEFGGGLLMPATTPVMATLFSANTGGACLLEKGKSAFKSEGHNISDDETCSLTAPGDRQGVATLLGPLAANGGPTQTLLPLPGSPAIDGGPASGCPATDQRGVARPQGPACDVGAVEVAPPTIATGPAHGIAAASAIVSGTGSNAGAQAGGVFFQYGTTASYGSQTAAQLLPAFIGPGTLTASLGGLAPHTLYHYRAVASTPEGTVFGADATFTTSLPPPPVLNHLAQSHATWRSGRALAHLSRHTKKRRPPTGTVFSFELNEAATVKLQFLTSAPGRLVARKCVAPKHSNRRRHRCTRSLTAGTLTLPGHAGNDKVSFSGRLSAKRALAPGTYTLVLTATDGFGQSSAPQRVKFKIVR
jgi:hypothetical protein